jgi:hypothetical protein
VSAPKLSELSRDERAAQTWHDRRHKGAYASCWCCCSACRMVNPRYDAARRAAVNDIFSRIADSIATARLK